MIRGDAHKDDLLSITGIALPPIQTCMTISPVTSAEDQQPISTIALSEENAGNCGGIMLTTSNGFAGIAIENMRMLMNTGGYSSHDNGNFTVNSSSIGGTDYH